MSRSGVGNINPAAPVGDYVITISCNTTVFAKLNFKVLKNSNPTVTGSVPNKAWLIGSSPPQFTLDSGLFTDNDFN